MKLESDYFFNAPSRVNIKLFPPTCLTVSVEESCLNHLNIIIMSVGSLMCPLKKSVQYITLHICSTVHIIQVELHANLDQRGKISPKTHGKLQK